jgi:hypothetical protein
MVTSARSEQEAVARQALVLVVEGTEQRRVDVRLRPADDLAVRPAARGRHPERDAEVIVLAHGQEQLAVGAELHAGHAFAVQHGQHDNLLTRAGVPDVDLRAVALLSARSN